MTNPVRDTSEESLSGDAFLAAVKFDDRGLVPAVAQDAGSGAVLMVAWMNRDALSRTLSSGDVTYWSRSRGALWRKGETSGHEQRLVEAWLDCDGDTVLLKVDQTGPACHTGAPTCFFRRATS
jgi:phosphoribosyl-AMP cyclohydrolase